MSPNRSSRPSDASPAPRPTRGGARPGRLPGRPRGRPAGRPREAAGRSPGARRASCGPAWRSCTWPSGWPSGPGRLARRQARRLSADRRRRTTCRIWLEPAVDPRSRPRHGPHIQLRELLDDREPLVRPRSPEMPDRDGSCRAGTSSRARSPAAAWGRPQGPRRRPGPRPGHQGAAGSHRGNPEVVRRFVEEAQIGGQLQHPGIVPVYELGTFRRPAAVLRHEAGQGPDPGRAAPRTDRARRHDLPRFLAIFEQICQTMAYAHARGVIHRDLKPSNVMVGIVRRGAGDGLGPGQGSGRRGRRRRGDGAAGPRKRSS